MVAVIDEEGFAWYHESEFKHLKRLNIGTVKKISSSYVSTYILADSGKIYRLHHTSGPKIRLVIKNLVGFVDMICKRNNIYVLFEDRSVKYWTVVDVVNHRSSYEEHTLETENEIMAIFPEKESICCLAADGIIHSLDENYKLSPISELKAYDVDYYSSINNECGIITTDGEVIFKSDGNFTGKNNEFNKKFDILVDPNISGYTRQLLILNLYHCYTVLVILADDNILKIMGKGHRKNFNSKIANIKSMHYEYDSLILLDTEGKLKQFIFTSSEIVPIECKCVVAHLPEEVLKIRQIQLKSANKT